jgi:Type IX secretion system protein PorV
MNISFFKKLAIALPGVLILSNQSHAQCKANLNGSSTCYRTITTAVPFLRISPDARSGAMGDCGVATATDANDQHWNIAKIAMNDKNMGLSSTYTPWLKDLVPDINLVYLSFFKKFGENNNQAFSTSLRYFNLGSIDFKGINAEDLGTGYPREYAFDAGYSRKLSENLSIGVAGRYIYSNIASGPSAQPGAQANHAGQSFATDIGVYYVKPFKKDGEETGNKLMMGAAITNLGTKVSYNDKRKDFIPTNLGIGASYIYKLDEFNTLTTSLEMNKLLVPSLQLGADSNLYYDEKTSVINGLFKSFSDAPGKIGGGGKWAEEFDEITWSAGAEYGYQNQFFARAGYFYENKYKGARQYATVGLGVKYNIFQLNFSYVIPSGNSIARNPLSNTLRFSLLFDFDKIAKRKEADKEESQE